MHKFLQFSSDVFPGSLHYPAKPGTVYTIGAENWLFVEISIMQTRELTNANESGKRVDAI
jgi:hypothetical protein